jgi:rubrerythrin
MRQATLTNLRNAFGGEAAAHMRYVVFSERAELENFPNVARMLRTIAFAEKVHASSHYRQSGELLGEYCVSFAAPFIYNRTVDNLDGAYHAEMRESEEFYTPFAEVARMQGEKHIAQNFEWMAQVEKGHSEMIRRVLDFMKSADEEPKIGPLYVCDICGYVIEGEPPEQCPVCKVKKLRFKLIE